MVYFFAALPVLMKRSLLLFSLAAITCLMLLSCHRTSSNTFYIRNMCTVPIAVQWQSDNHTNIQSIPVNSQLVVWVSSGTDGQAKRPVINDSVTIAIQQILRDTAGCKKDYRSLGNWEMAAKDRLNRMYYFTVTDLDFQ